MASWPREQWPLWDQRVLSQHPIVYNLSSSFSQGGITAAAWNQSCACLKRYGTFCYVSKRDPVAEFAAPVAAVGGGGAVFTLSITVSIFASAVIVTLFNSRKLKIKSKAKTIRIIMP